MYAGIDIGGTKTLVAALSDDGQIQQKVRFVTPHKYQDFLAELKKAVDSLETKDWRAAGIGVPGRLDRQAGRVIRLGNLPWENCPIRDDCQQILKCPTIIENDANLAGLSEAMLHKESETVLYLTVSTGIGTGVIYRQQLEPALLDGEGGHILLPYQDEWMVWEKFASGSALYKHFGKKVEEIAPNDHGSWQYIADNLALGIIENMAIVQPDLIIIGGGVGGYFDNFEKPLRDRLSAYRDKASFLNFPSIVKAQRPEEAVLFGCYELAKQEFGDGRTD